MMEDRKLGNGEWVNELLWKVRTINPPRSVLVNTRGGGGVGGRRRMTMTGRRGRRIHVAEEVFL